LYDSPTSLFLADPPYVPDTRRGGKYTHELTVADHQELVGILLRLQGKAILCGYNHPVYDVLVVHGWSRRSTGITCSLAGRTRVSGLQGEGKVSEQQQREESVWISPGAERSPRTLLG
jgi:DNA adenine methylase